MPVDPAQLKVITMPRTESENQFDQMMAQNQQNLLQARGATSPFRPIDCPDSTYYACLTKVSREIVTEKVYVDGKETGATQKVPRVQFKLIIVADANPQCPPGQKEQYQGVQGYINYNLTPGNQDRWDRLMADLENLGVPTRNFVPTEQHIQNPQVQLTMAQGLEMLNRGVPDPTSPTGYRKLYCTISVATTPKGKFTNYRDVVPKEAIEQWIGHKLDEAAIVMIGEDKQQTPQIPMGQQMNPMNYQQPGAVQSPLTGQQVYPPAVNQPVGAAYAPQQGMPMPQPQMGGMQPPNMPMAPAAAPAAPQPGPPVYPQAGADFAGDQANLVWQPADNLFFDNFSKHYYDQFGKYAPVTPKLPEPPAPPAPPMMPQMPMAQPMGMPQQPPFQPTGMMPQPTPPQMAQMPQLPGMQPGGYMPQPGQYPQVPQ